LSDWQFQNTVHVAEFYLIKIPQCVSIAYHTVNRISHYVLTGIHGNGQNSTPHIISTYYLITTKTLHNWLRPRDQHVTQSCADRSECKNGTPEQMTNALSFYSYYFIPGLAYSRHPWVDFEAQWLKTRRITQICAFWGSHNGRQHIWVQSQTSKLSVNVQFRAS